MPEESPGQAARVSVPGCSLGRSTVALPKGVLAETGPLTCGRAPRRDRDDDVAGAPALTPSDWGVAFRVSSSVSHFKEGPGRIMAKINIERMMHRNSIAVLGETAASYCLVKLIP